MKALCCPRLLVFTDIVWVTAVAGGFKQGFDRTPYLVLSTPKGLDTVEQKMYELLSLKLRSLVSKRPWEIIQFRQGNALSYSSSEKRVARTNHVLVVVYYRFRSLTNWTGK